MQTNTPFTSIHVVYNSSIDAILLEKIHTALTAISIEDGNIRTRMYNIDTMEHSYPDPCQTPSPLVLAIGGDGTFCAAARYARMMSNAAGVLGIHNSGRVGFLYETMRDLNWENEIRSLLYPNYIHSPTIFTEREPRYFLTVKIEGEEGELHRAFNDIVISRQESDSIVSCNITYTDNNRSLQVGTHRSTALVLSTPTGCTAYGLGGGGAILMPEMQAMQMVQIAPLSLSSRPIIFPGTGSITVEVDDEMDRANGKNFTIVKCDGQPIFSRERLEGPLKATISMDPAPIQVLRSKDWNFFKSLTEKLGWKQHAF